MAKSTATPSLTLSETAPDAVAHTNAVGFAQTNAARLSDDTRAIVGIFRDANAEKGDRKMRAQTNARTLAAMVLADVERSASLAQTARGTRVGVEVESKLRGEKTRQTVSLPVIDVLRAITFGGMVQGGGRLV
jgi:hypothetical protein